MNLIIYDKYMELWIARDKVGELRLYNEKPIKETTWFYCEGRSLLLYDNLFPEVTFENSPQRVKIELIK